MLTAKEENEMTLPTVIEQKGIRVLTSKQIAEKYETSTDIIKKNFSNNRKRYVEGKHYILLTGDELKAFKNQVNNVHLSMEEHHTCTSGQKKARFSTQSH